MAALAKAVKEVDPGDRRQASLPVLLLALAKLCQDDVDQQAVAVNAGVLPALPHIFKTGGWVQGTMTMSIIITIIINIITIITGIIHHFTYGIIVIIVIIVVD